ncbi:hypothetical protein DBV15_07819 [Temnothorax longispinosus]|uniref:Uncharacterized protein n=1 Tax=Temnothorax longispinosus TaxID=300112 RepID=A0A4V3S8Q9_9HYME|nr:hypothetical protein DBV15_07819 [Temnothorax longispinosus]
MYIISGSKVTRARRGAERGSIAGKRNIRGRVKARNALPQNNRRSVSLPTVTRHHALHFVNFHIRHIVRNGIPWRVAPPGPLKLPAEVAAPNPPSIISLSRRGSLTVLYTGLIHSAYEFSTCVASAEAPNCDAVPEHIIAVYEIHHTVISMQMKDKIETTYYSY